METLSNTSHCHQVNGCLLGIDEHALSHLGMFWVQPGIPNGPPVRARGVNVGRIKAFGGMQVWVAYSSHCFQYVRKKSRCL